MRAIFVVALVATVLGADSTYQQQIEQWRAHREARLRADDGWLTVAGLFWLNQGDISLMDVRLRLNESLLSVLARSKSFPYGTPREAFRAMRGGTKS